MSDIWTEERLKKADELKRVLIELSNQDPIFMQMLIEAAMIWHAYGAARENEVKTCFILDSMAKHAKQLMLGPNMIAEGQRRTK